MPSSSPRADTCIRTVLFDLDGTLLDTAPDLAYALNETLREFGCAPLPYASIRPVVSHGGVALIRLGFGLGPGDEGYIPRRQRLLEIYRANIARATRPFAGMEDLLAALESQGLNWGVVTNKPAWLTEPLLRELGLYERAATVVSGDTLKECKPHPAPMLHACEFAGSQPHECLYVGDAKRDIEAGHNAGMATLVALFGYIGDDDDPHGWGADALVETPAEILDWIAARITV
ncbi:MAG TPA: HAD-IA family hydrolase [Gammaproteobacteria bacterium]